MSDPQPVRHPLERPPEPIRHPLEQPPPAPSPATPRPVARILIPGVKPLLTYGFLIANILVFGLDYLLGGRLLFLGMKQNDAIMAGQYWRLVTPLFLHGGLLHLGVNSYSLYIVGPQIERPLGYWRFVAVYLLSGIAGVVASFALSDVASIGASGAIFGLVGALVPYLYRNRKLFGGMARRRLMGLVQVIVLNLLIGFAPGTRIDNWGHVGGLVGGLVLGWFVTPLYKLEADFDGSPRLIDQSSPRWAWLTIFWFLVALAAMTLILSR